MSWSRKITSRLRAPFRRDRLEADMADELLAHLEMLEAANRAAGMSPDEARFAARRQFGGLDQIKETARDQRGWVWLEQSLQDVRFAVRTLVKSAGFTAVAVALLALGIGANTAFFSIFKAEALAPFPYPEAGRVVQLWRTQHSQFEANPWSAPDFLDVHDQCASLAESGAFRADRFNLGGENPEALHGVSCTPGVLRALGMQPALGRWFTDEDERRGAPLVVILSHACWTRHFGADSALVGRTIRLNAQNYTVAGVMPANFEFYSPHTGTQAIDLWVPLRLTREGQSRDDNWLLVLGRLQDNATVESANAELALIANRLAAAYPDTNSGKRFYARPLTVELVARFALRNGLVIPAIALVLLVACANLAIMFLARGAGRQVEYAVRLALGAGRWRVIRLALTESLVVALLGGAAGVLLAENATGLLAVLLPPASTHATAVHIDRVVLTYSFLLALGASFLAGLPPALTAAKTQVMETIRDGGPTQAGSRTRHRFLRHLVSAQMAIALLLVNTALLLLAGYRAALLVNQPLSSEFVLSAAITAKGGSYGSGDGRTMLWERFVERVRMLPGVTAAGMTTKLPLRGGMNTEILAEGEVFDPTIDRPTIEMSFVSTDYFAAMGITQLRGRTFEIADARPETLGVVVNRALADRYWPGRDPLGQRVRGNTREPWFAAQVVGVVENVRQWDIAHPALPEIYFPYGGTRSTAYLVVRSAFDSHRMVPLLRSVLAAVDSDLALADPSTMAEIVTAESRERRALLLLTDLFMGTTLAMAGIGIYGTLAFQIRQRTREIGVRLALGAARSDIVRLVVRQTVPWLLRGGVTGLLLSAGVACVLQRIFVDVNWLNPLYYLGGAAILGTVTALACWLPARRATRVNPAEILKAE